MALAITEEHVSLAEVVGEFATEQGVRAATRRAVETAPLPGAEPDPLWKQIAGLPDGGRPASAAGRARPR